MCGNFGLLFIPCSRASEHQHLRRRPFEDIVHEQVEKTRIRGSQAAGLSIVGVPSPFLAASASGADEIVDLGGQPTTNVRVRVIPKKRQSVSSALLEGFRRSASLATRQLLVDGVVTCIGHSRFATSSR